MFWDFYSKYFQSNKTIKSHVGPYSNHTLTTKPLRTCTLFTVSGLYLTFKNRARKNIFQTWTLDRVFSLNVYWRAMLKTIFHKFIVIKIRFFEILRHKKHRARLSSDHPPGPLVFYYTWVTVKMFFFFFSSEQNDKAIKSTGTCVFFKIFYLQIVFLELFGDEQKSRLVLVNSNRCFRWHLHRPETGDSCENRKFPASRTNGRWQNHTLITWIIAVQMAIYKRIIARREKGRKNNLSPRLLSVNGTQLKHYTDCAWLNAVRVILDLIYILYLHWSI